MTTAPDESHRRWSFSLRTLLALVTIAGVAALLAARYWEASRPIEWRPFSQQAVRYENAAGRHVLVSFMATWDPISAMQCQMIDTPPIRRLLRSKGIVAVKADYTNSDPVITAELHALGRNSTPLLVLYPASGGSPTILGDLVTAEDLAAQLEKL
jgi:thiol:disulfide interchange protein DsbD